MTHRSNKKGNTYQNIIYFCAIPTTDLTATTNPLSTSGLILVGLFRVIPRCTVVKSKRKVDWLVDTTWSYMASTNQSACGSDFTTAVSGITRKCPLPINEKEAHCRPVSQSALSRLHKLTRSVRGHAAFQREVNTAWPAMWEGRWGAALLESQAQNARLRLVNKTQFRGVRWNAGKYECYHCFGMFTDGLSALTTWQAESCPVGIAWAVKRDAGMGYEEDTCGLSRWELDIVDLDLSFVGLLQVDSSCMCLYETG